MKTFGIRYKKIIIQKFSASQWEKEMKQISLDGSLLVRVYMYELETTSDIPFNIDLGHINQGTNNYLFLNKKLLSKPMQPETAEVSLFQTMLNEKSACLKNSAL